MITPTQWYVLVFVVSSVGTLMGYSIFRLIWGYWPPSMLELTVRGLRRFEAWHRTWRTYKPAKVIHVHTAIGDWQQRAIEDSRRKRQWPYDEGAKE